jgi:hypothetical protein
MFEEKKIFSIGVLTGVKDFVQNAVLHICTRRQRVNILQLLHVSTYVRHYQGAFFMCPAESEPYAKPFAT